MRTIKILESPDNVAEFAAGLLREELTQHAGGSRYSIALSGGSTPRRMYRVFSQMANAGALCREAADFYFSDERTVGPDSDDSNFRTAHLGLFQPLSIDEGLVHRMKGEAPDPGFEASRYEKLIRARLAHQAREIPSFDLIFLGMGADGHTASLFPAVDLGSCAKSLVAAPFIASLGTYRLTFTLELINQARKVLFLVTGAEKSTAVTKALSCSIKHDIVPAGRVEAGRTIWLLDRDAASQLDRREIDGIEIEC
jgi:6-phosphogluconolactonase